MATALFVALVRIFVAIVLIMTACHLEAVAAVQPWVTNFRASAYLASLYGDSGSDG